MIGMEICEIVPGYNGNHKINARGYLMVKERSRDDVCYWCCIKRRSLTCKGRLTTLRKDETYYIQKFVEHNHPPNMNDAVVRKTIDQIKIDSLNSNKLPSQIIQTHLNKNPKIEPYLPSKSAMLKTIKRTRRSQQLRKSQRFIVKNISGVSVNNFLEDTLEHLAPLYSPPPIKRLKTEADFSSNIMEPNILLTQPVASPLQFQPETVSVFTQPSVEVPQPITVSSHVTTDLPQPTTAYSQPSKASMPSSPASSLNNHSPTPAITKKRPYMTNFADQEDEVAAYAWSLSVRLHKLTPAIRNIARFRVEEIMFEMTKSDLDQTSLLNQDNKP